MAERSRAFADNAPGSYFVDDTCIDCGTCHGLTPAVFEDAGGRSRVHHQPAGPEERLRAGMALVSSPTSSIGTDDRSVAREAAGAFPLTLEDEVGFCGYTSEKGFGAWSYLVERPDGNVLVDSPRAAETGG